ncbi:hypothetical protein ACFQGT_17795 [Natrialbaceae archaeon GCM10025810]|uniref:hypothetical protein n=1 Tax=Halovalidus salilacus TaxID=3075124 RepID=UPI003623A247
MFTDGNGDYTPVYRRSRPSVSGLDPEVVDVNAVRPPLTVQPDQLTAQSDLSWHRPTRESPTVGVETARQDLNSVCRPFGSQEKGTFVVSLREDRALIGVALAVRDSVLDRCLRGFGRHFTMTAPH